MNCQGWNSIEPFFNGGTLHALLEANEDALNVPGVYVHVDCETNRVVRIGLAIGPGGVFARWRNSHSRSYRYHDEHHLRPGTHVYPGFFRWLHGRETQLCWIRVADRQTAKALERLLIHELKPAWERYRAAFTANGAAAKDAVTARDWPALSALGLGELFVADCIGGAEEWACP